MRARASKIHQLIRAIPNTQDLSDPSTLTWLPFPSLLDVPTRFTKSGRDDVHHFQYMGRSTFLDLDKRSKEANFADSSERLYVYGTSGSGKSHILAAFVCNLIRTGHRVVYIPDCFRLLEHHAWVFWTALVFAFHDAPDLNSIPDPTDVDALVAFMLRQRHLYVIVDQKNALELKTNDPHADTKRKVGVWLDQMKLGHRYIYSASANEVSSQEAHVKQGGIGVFEVLGGMTRVSVMHSSLLTLMPCRMKRHSGSFTTRVVFHIYYCMSGLSWSISPETFPYYSIASSTSKRLMKRPSCDLPCSTKYTLMSKRSFDRSKLC